MRSWFIRLLGGFTAEQVAAAYTRGVLDNELRHLLEANELAQLRADRLH